MLKPLMTAALIGTIALSATACSSNNESKESASPLAPAATSAAPTASASVDVEKSKSLAYIAARLAEEKVNGLFHQEASEDGKPILNPITPDRQSAANFLNAYLDPALTDKVLAHYLTEEKAGNAIVVKSDKFFSSSIMATASKNDVAFEGSPDEYKMTTQDGGLYTVRKVDEKTYLVTDYVKA